MTIDVEIGQASRRGTHAHNEDFAGIRVGDAADADRGVIAAIADGVSAGGGGRMAAQTSVLTLLADYYAAPATWDTSVVLDRVVGAHNAWLLAHNRRGGATAMTTLTALVLRGHGYTVAHAGDSMAYLWRAGELGRLTQDHAFGHLDMRSRLVRAVGLDDALHLDYLQGELLPDDTFLLTTDGVHGRLAPARLATLLSIAGAQPAAEAIVEAAQAAGGLGGADDATAVVLRVRALAASQLGDAQRRASRLPVPRRLKVGDRVDDQVVTALVADTGVHLLYQTRDAASGALRALKTLHPSRANDAQERAMLAHEAWLAERIGEHAADGFVRLIGARQPSAYYLLYEWHAGQTLEQRLTGPGGDRPAVADVVAWGQAAGRALGRLHRLGVIHRDVKPANLHLGDDGRLRLLDLGSALSGSEPADQRTLQAGTPSYMNPELWDGAAPGPQGDLYALGVTFYRLLTGHLPYGEIEPYQALRYRRDPKAPSRLRPEVPMWLDHLVLKAVSRDAGQRFETAEELVLALERGASRPLLAPLGTPLAVREAAMLWRIACGLSALLNLLLVFWLLFLPK